MKHYEQLVSKLKEIDEIKKDLEELKNDTIIKIHLNLENPYSTYGDNNNCNDYWFDIIWNLQERHLRIYCAKNWRLDLSFYEEWIYADINNYWLDWQICRLDNTKDFHLQDDKVYKQILDYINNNK